MLQSFLTAANTALSPFDFTIRTLPSQTTPAAPGAPRTTYYVLTNITSDSLVQVATTHSAEEIAFFRRLLDCMFETNNTPRLELCAVRSMDAVKLHKPRPGDLLLLPLPSQLESGGGGGGGGSDPDAGPSSSTQQAATQQATTSTAGLSMKEAELALRAFVTEGWLELSPTGWYTLSPRSIAELQQYLLDTYNIPDEEGVPIDRVKSCHGCKELLTIGQRCENLDCPIRLHDACTEGFFRMSRQRKCPSCGGDWEGNKFVGERAAKGKTRTQTT